MSYQSSPFGGVTIFLVGMMVAKINELIIFGWNFFVSDKWVFFDLGVLVVYFTHNWKSCFQNGQHSLLARGMENARDEVVPARHSAPGYESPRARSSRWQHAASPW